MTDLTPEVLNALASLAEDATEGPWETYENIHAETAVVEVGRGGFGVVALPATGRPDYGRANMRYIAALGTAAPGLIAAARERDALARWKSEALPVMDGLQELGRALGTPLGKSITARESVDLALDLRNERDSARAELADLRERVEAICVGWDDEPNLPPAAYNVIDAVRAALTTGGDCG